MVRSNVILALAFVLAGCASPRIDQDAESRARQHILLADSLQRVGDLSKSLLEYGLVAELYPRTSYYPAAVRSLAFLHTDPEAPVANDSTALFWLDVYRQLPVPPAERKAIILVHSLVAKLKTIRLELSLESLVADSLAFVARKQGAEITTKARRVQELEEQLEQANTELTKLKEVDLRMSRSREKK
jgi:hypothetical protein